MKGWRGGWEGWVGGHRVAWVGGTGLVGWLDGSVGGWVVGWMDE